jgi:hypothetical protein
MKPAAPHHTAVDKRMLELERALEAAIAEKGPQSEAIFQQIHDLVESAIRRGLSHKLIITNINSTYKLKLHPASFRDLLSKARSSLPSGHGPLCARCGQEVPIDGHVDSGPKAPPVSTQAAALNRSNITKVEATE